MNLCFSGGFIKPLLGLVILTLCASCTEAQITEFTFRKEMSEKRCQKRDGVLPAQNM